MKRNYYLEQLICTVDAGTLVFSHADSERLWVIPSDSL